jgi:hypothetical protein
MVPIMGGGSRDWRSLASDSLAPWQHRPNVVCPWHLVSILVLAPQCPGAVQLLWVVRCWTMVSRTEARRIWERDALSLSTMVCSAALANVQPFMSIQS